MSDAIILDPRVLGWVSRHPCPLLFATISGAHLYGFSSPDSDVDLRGAHILSARTMLGLCGGKETIEQSHAPASPEDLEIDLVTHDVRKFFLLLLRKNGYVLEQLYSPLVVHTTPEHAELKALAAGCITRFHVHHYLGFAETQWKLFHKESPPRIKPLLYVYRVLLTGIHLMRTGRIEANLVRLHEAFGLPAVGELIARKVAGSERGALSDADLGFHEREYGRLRGVLEQAGRESTLPENASARGALNDLLVRLRLGTLEGASRG